MKNNRTVALLLKGESKNKGRERVHSQRVRWQERKLSRSLMVPTDKSSDSSIVTKERLSSPFRSSSHQIPKFKVQ